MELNTRAHDQQQNQFHRDLQREIENGVMQLLLFMQERQKLSQWDKNGCLLHVIYDDLKIWNKHFDSQYIFYCSHARLDFDYLNKLGVVLPIIQNSPLVENIQFRFELTTKWMLSK